MDIRYLSRSRSFLWKSSVSIFLVGIALAWIFKYSPSEKDLLNGYGGEVLLLSHAKLDQFDAEYFIRLESFIETEGLGASKCLDLLDTVGRIVPASSRDELVKAIERNYGESVAQVASDYLLVSLEGSVEARERLIEKATIEPVVRHSNRLLSKLAMVNGLRRESARFLEREGEFSDADEERNAALNLYRETEDVEALYRLSQNPKYSEIIMDWDRMLIAIAHRDWWDALKFQIRNEYLDINVPVALLALLGGLVWGVIVFRFNNSEEPLWRDLVLCSVAFVLGMVSTTPTVFLIAIFETYFGIQQDGDVVNDLRFYIVSVGLREEFCKMVMFLPLVPFLVKSGSELRAIVVAGFVGLGFAVDENIGYFGRSFAVDGVGRFLTANFFHIGMTGLCGLYFVRGISIRGYSLMDFGYVFGAVVFVHGLYDALISLPQFGELGYFSMTAYILLSYRFFAEVHTLRGTGHSAVSVTAIFTIGLSVFVSMLLVYVSSQVGFEYSLMAVAQSLLGVGIVAFMFFREFREEIYD